MATGLGLGGTIFPAGGSGSALTLEFGRSSVCCYRVIWAGSVITWILNMLGYLLFMNVIVEFN